MDPDQFGGCLSTAWVFFFVQVILDFTLKDYSHINFQYNKYVKDLHGKTTLPLPAHYCHLCCLARTFFSSFIGVVICFCVYDTEIVIIVVGRFAFKTEISKVLLNIPITDLFFSKFCFNFDIQSTTCECKEPEVKDIGAKPDTKFLLCDDSWPLFCV